jgi:hypothetical protein
MLSTSNILLMFLALVVLAVWYIGKCINNKK